MGLSEAPAHQLTSRPHFHTYQFIWHRFHFKDKLWRAWKQVINMRGEYNKEEAKD